MKNGNSLTMDKSIPETSTSIKYRLAICLCLLLLTNALTAGKWKTYTNTNHVTDCLSLGTGFYSATWGGMVQYNRQSGSPLSPSALTEASVMTVTDGIASNDLRFLAAIPFTGDVWLGTYNDGISILTRHGVLSLKTEAGLLSNKVRRVAVRDSLIFVATDLGISQFYYLPTVSFPLLGQRYTLQSTSNGILSENILDMCITPQGYLYCATPAGVSFAHTDSLDLDAAWHQWTPANTPLPSEPVLSLSYNNTSLVLTTATTVLKTGNNPFAPQWQIWSQENDALPDEIFICQLSSDGTLRLAYGTWNEDTMTLNRSSQTLMSEISPTGILTHLTEGQNGLPTTSIYRICSVEGYPVLCSWGDGLFFRYGTSWLSLQNNCPGFQTVTEIRTDQDNRIWLASGNISGGMTRKGTRGVSCLSDGIWTNYMTRNSPLTSDNIWTLEVDSHNHKLFGSWATSNASPSSWNAGITYLDDEQSPPVWRWYARLGMKNWNADSLSWSDLVSGSPQLFNATIAELANDQHGNIFIACSGGGVIVFNSHYERIADFQIPNSQYQQVISIYHDGSRYFFGTNNDYGLVIWNEDSLPTTNGSRWLIPPPSEFNNCIVYGISSITTIFGEEQSWIATSRGLFMWDGSYWYKYDTDIKRRRYSSGTWVNDVLYYYDEERLFGSVRTTPTCILRDPFNRLWIGSGDNGLSMYDPETEHFTNYFKATSPLLTNYITCLGYEPISGNLLIGTPEGLNTLFIGIAQKTQTRLETVQVFPNPFCPERDGILQIVNLPSHSMPLGKNTCRIYDVSGQLVIDLPESITARFEWNGNNKYGKQCSSGIYYYLVSDNKGTIRRGKIALIRSL